MLSPSVLAGEIPTTGEPGGIIVHGVVKSWAISTDQLTCMHTRKNVSDITVSQKWHLWLQVILTVIYILLISKT